MRCGPGRPWSSSIQVHGHTKHGSRPPVLPVWAMGPRLPIHTTMAQPLAFLILDGIGWEPRVYPSPDGPPRYESSPPKPIQSQLCTPMQQPMRRLNNELGHKVVDKVWMFMWMLVHMEGWHEKPKACNRVLGRLYKTCASVHKSHVSCLVSRSSVPTE